MATRIFLPRIDHLKLTWAGAADINKIIMLGVPNEGSADAFSTLIEGYSITEGLRQRIPLLNRLTAEESITAPAIFQLLPHSKVAKFLDENLQPLALDLYDPETWKRYGWSPINDPEYRRRYEKGAAKAEGAHPRKRSLEELDGYLAAVLQRAKLVSRRIGCSASWRFAGDAAGDRWRL